MIERQVADRRQHGVVHMANDPVAPGLQVKQAQSHPDAVVESAYCWYGTVDALQAARAGPSTVVELIAGVVYSFLPWAFPKRARSTRRFHNIFTSFIAWIDSSARRQLMRL